MSVLKNIYNHFRLLFCSVANTKHSSSLRHLQNGKTKFSLILMISLGVLIVGFLILWFVPFSKVSYPNNSAVVALAVATTTALATTTPEIPVFVVTHLKTPDPLKAVYMTSWAAGNAKFRKELFDLVDNTEINAVVIDVKDYSGRISFHVDDPMLKKIGAEENRISDIKEFIGKLHEKNVYVIARISSFQDSFLINIHPEWAVKTKSSDIWKDYKSVKWLDPGATPVWDYLVAIGKQSYEYGFDELNFDYIRYPSDGNMKDLAYSWSDGRTRREVMKSFYMYLSEQFTDMNIPLSADLFGLTTSSEDDLGIGQYMEDALPYFDYISPMVYPSHFGTGYIGLKKPAEHPYEVIKYAMEKASERATLATSSPSKLRPWLQAFSLGTVYTPAMVRAQIQATYDVGLTSWMLWHAGSVYDKNYLMPKDSTTSQ